MPPSRSYSVFKKNGPTLDLNGYNLSISNGNMVELPEPPVYTAGTGISIQNHVVSNTGDGDETNELQTLSISGNVLSLSDQFIYSHNR